MKYLDLKGLQYYTGKVQTEIDSAKGEVNSALQNHILNGSNPHIVTKDQVGLANVTNDAQVKRSEMGSANGVATLNESGTVPYRNSRRTLTMFLSMIINQLSLHLVKPVRYMQLKILI